MWTVKHSRPAIRAKVGQTFDIDAVGEPRDLTVMANSSAGLAVLGGGEPSDELVSDIQSLSRWPANVVEHLWELLEPNLAEPLPADIEYKVRHFCRAHDVTPDQLGPGVRALRAVIRGGATFDISADDILADLTRIDAGTATFGGTFKKGYESAKQLVRTQLQVASLLDHGKVIDSVSWRVDRMAASQHGRSFDSAVVWLTFTYREGEDKGRVSFQAPPAILRQLQAICATVLE